MTMMSEKEFDKALEALGLERLSAANMLDVDERTIRKWRSGDRTVQGPAKQFLRFLLAEGYSGKEVIEILKRSS